MENPFKVVVEKIKGHSNEQEITREELPQAVKDIVNEYENQHNNQNEMFSINVRGIKREKDNEYDLFIIEGTKYMHDKGKPIGADPVPVKIVVEMKGEEMIEYNINGQHLNPEAKVEEDK